MRRPAAFPRLAREGWVPATPKKRVSKCAMLIPKTGNPSDHLPTLMDFSEVICPPERRALREIVETAEVVREGDHLYLLARVSAATLDSLATFETSREDLEEHDEPSIFMGSTRSWTPPMTSRTTTTSTTSPGSGKSTSQTGRSLDASTYGMGAASSTRRPMMPPGTRRSSRRSSAR